MLSKLRAKSKNKKATRLKQDKAQRILYLKERRIKNADSHSVMNHEEAKILAPIYRYVLRKAVNKFQNYEKFFYVFIRNKLFHDHRLSITNSIEKDHCKDDTMAVQRTIFPVIHSVIGHTENYMHM